jgi:hypothetical protein
MITWKQLCQTVLTASATSVYTADAATAAAIHQASAFNSTGSVAAVKVYIVPVSGAAADATTVTTVNVPAGLSRPLPDLIGHKLQAGMQIFAVGDGVTLTISGAENVQ